MRLAYVGNFRPQHSTENHVASAFSDLGWDVVRVQEDEVNTRHTWPARALPLIAGSDLVLYTRTHAFGLPRLATTTWKALEDKGVVTASLHLDLFFGLERERLVWAPDPLFTTSRVFTPDGNEHPWSVHGVRHTWLRAGVHRAEARPGAVDPRWAGYDVAFVGSGRGYHREWPYRQHVIRALKRQYGDRFLLVPSDTQPAVRGQALNDLYATVPVVVGDSLCLGREPAQSRYWSDRVYETLGRGGVLVMPRIAALMDEVGHLPAMHSYEWHDWPGLVRTVNRLLEQFHDDGTAHAAVTQASSAWVRDNCSYTNRVMAMLNVLDLDYARPVALSA